MIEIEIRSQFVSVPETCFHKSSNLILALHMASSFEVRPSIRIFCPRECFLRISIFSSLPSTSMLHHMSVSDSSSTISSTYHSFWVNVKDCSPVVRLSNILSIQSLTLSEHLIASDCGNLSSFPMSSVCQLSSWSTEPIEHSSTHWQLEWPRTIRLYLPLLRLLKSESEKEVWDVITRRTMLWHRNDWSSYHCPGNWTGWEQTPRVERTENPVSASLESSSCTWWLQSRMYRSIIMAAKPKTNKMRFTLPDSNLHPTEHPTTSPTTFTPNSKNVFSVVKNDHVSTWKKPALCSSWIKEWEPRVREKLESGGLVLSTSVTVFKKQSLLRSKRSPCGDDLPMFLCRIIFLTSRVVFMIHCLMQDLLYYRLKQLTLVTELKGRLFLIN